MALGSTAAILNVLVTANTKPAIAALGRTQAGLLNTAKTADRTTNALKKVGTVGALGAAAAFGYAVKKAADFEQQMDSLAAVTDATGRQMEQFEKQAMKAGAATKFSALEAAKAQTELAKGGLSVRQIMRGGLKSALALAAAGELELADAAETTANAIKLFGLRGKDTMKVADALATAANRTTADVEDFAMALKMGGSVARLAGLNFTDTVVILEALAEAGIKGSDAGTSLKAFFLNITRGVPKAREAMKDLGLEIFNSNGQLKELPALSAELRRSFGDLTKEQFLQKAGVIAGSDAVRTLWALYDAGPNKLRKLQSATEKQGTAADVARKKQKNFRGAMEQLHGSVETLAITIGLKLLPWLTKVANKLTKFVNQMQSGKGPGGQFADALKDIGQAFKDVGEAVGPKLKAIATFAVEHKKVTAMATALTLLAVAYGKLRGGGGKLGGLGKMLGVAKPIPVFVTNPGFGGGKPGGGVLGKVGGAAAGGGARAILGGASIAVASGVGIAVAAHILKRTTGFGLPLDRDIGKKEGQRRATQTPSAQRPAIPGSVGLSERLAAQEKARLEQSKRRHNAWSDSVKTSLGHVQEAQQHHVAASRQAFQAAGDRLQNLRERTATITKHIKERFGSDTAKGRDALARHYRQAANAAKAQMDRTGVITTQGLAFIRNLFIKEQMLYGATRSQAQASFKQQQSDQTSHKPFRGSGAQRGGFINQGKPSGDSVPAVLERGEYVLNRKAVAKVGKQHLDAVNFKQAPRMQGGGIVGLGRQLQQQGFQVGEHPAFGGVGGSHVQGSYHYKGQALDVNWPDVGAEPTKLDRLYARLKNVPGIVELLWRVAGHFDHLHVAMTGAGGALPGLDPPKIGPIEIVNGPQGALGNIASAGLDAARRTANKRLAELFPGIEGAEAGRMGGNAALNMRIGKQLAARYGWGRGPQWGALVELWNRESGWDNMARNPSSGAFGIPQGLPPEKMGAAAAGGNAEAQIRWGLNYIAGRYGSPSGALAFHDANNWYQSGGPVGMLFGGGARGATWRPGTGFANPAWAGAFPAGGRPGSHLTQQMNRAVNVVGGLNKKGKRFPAKVRSRVLKRFLERVKGMGLPNRLEGNIKKYADQAAIFGDYATTASTLGSTDAAGNEIPGMYQSMPETHWLTQQLDQLFLLRNALVRAQEIFAEKRQVTKLLFERGRNRMERLFDDVRAGAKAKAKLEDRLKELKKHPVQNAEQIKAVKKQIKGIEERQGVRTRERDTLKNRILPTLKNQRSSLATGFTENLSAIETVQGLGRPMTRMKSLPGIGVLGGDILTIQTRLRGAGQAPAITDTSSAESSESSELLKELLRQANLRTAVSQAQYAALQSMPFAGSFQTGGVIPGPIGQPQMAVVHGGETVTPVGAAPSVHVSFANGMEWLAQFVDIRVNGQTRKATQRRPLPGRGGGVLR